MPLERLLDRVITDSGYDRALLALPDGRRRMANVRKLMRLARAFEAEQGGDLRAFIDDLAEQDVLAAREGEAPLEAEDLGAVRLMTIHAAKGLEFPVVCVADLGRSGKGDDDALRVTDDGRVGLKIASHGRRLGEGPRPGGDRGPAEARAGRGGAADLLRRDDASTGAARALRCDGHREVAGARSCSACR